MGNKQLLLIVLSIIMVIIAILYGVSMFQQHYEAAQRDALIAELNYIQMRTYAFWIQTISVVDATQRRAIQRDANEVDNLITRTINDWLIYDDMVISSNPGIFFSSSSGVFTLKAEHFADDDTISAMPHIVVYAAGFVKGKNNNYLNSNSWGNSRYTFPDGSGRRGKKGLICYKTTFNFITGEVTIKMLN